MGPWLAGANASHKYHSQTEERCAELPIAKLTLVTDKERHADLEISNVSWCLGSYETISLKL